MAHKQSSVRAGRVVRQVAGYRAFVPVPLPPDPPLTMDAELIRLLMNHGLGRLKTRTHMIG
jgi:hypothetical protein